MANADNSAAQVNTFIAYWSAASPSERSNSQRFLLELCDLLDVPRPDNQPHAGYFFEYPVTENHPDGSTSTGRIDLYKRGCFVLESKQFQEAKAEQSQLQLAAEEAGVVTRRKSSQPVRGTGAWDDAMAKARGQAERYLRSLPETNPPFVVVVDVGHTFELFADFTQAGKAYQPFPDPRTFRIRLADLADANIRERLRLVWTNPAALDPARVSADVTREVSAHLAELAKSLEQAGHEPDVVAQFLTRCLFCMFAEDVGLLPDDAFTELLDSLPADGAGFQDLMSQLFREMNTGTGPGISVVLRKKLLQFNGGLFADDTVLPVNGLQLGLLKEAARSNWRSVEPAIFGTLLERALNPADRSRLGAHFTPRAYVERLVLPTIIEPLRAEWGHVRAAALTHGSRSEAKLAKAVELTESSRSKQKSGDLAAAKEDFRLAKEAEKSALAELEAARKAINSFHTHLCSLKVLDPACGTGNFLYVSLQQLKVLEGEVLDEATKYGENFKLELETHTVDPHQFLGLEINPRAAAIAELVLWIGYLQWHYRIHGQRTPPEPILRAFKNIECRDAVLAYDEVKDVTWAMAHENPNLPGLPDTVRTQLRDDTNQPSTRDHQPITVWDRTSTKPDLVTGRDVPDETKRVPLLAYANPRPADWPYADYIVGNPPFIGPAMMRQSLGDGYAETLRETYPDVPESADFVLYWWHKAAGFVRGGHAERFGLITTNSLRQTFARRVVQAHLQPPPPKEKPGVLYNISPRLSLAFAIPDHPWVDTEDGAAVRIAMTVGVAGEQSGELLEVTDEQPQDDGSAKVTFSTKNGQISPDLRIGADVTNAVQLQANDGLANRGFCLFGKGFVVTSGKAKSLGLGTQSGLERHIRPFCNGKDLTDKPREVMVIDLFGLSADEVRVKYPDTYQHVFTHVKPERDENKRESRRINWWVFGEPNKELRRMLTGLPRYIATTETSKHRMFQFLDAEMAPDNMLVVIALNDAFHLGVLSSRIHVTYALTAGGRLGVGNDPRYNKSRCFDPFPFPLCGEPEKDRIRRLAEDLDAHRKRAQADHGLTLTGIYNVLEKLRGCARESTADNSSGAALTAKEKLIHDQGLVSVLKQLHDDLDAAVFAAYGWPANLTDAEILERLVALNAERAAEEKRGIIHWLRPEYQTKRHGTTLPVELPFTVDKPKKHTKAKTTKPKGKTPWPATLADRVRAVEAALHAAAGPATAEDLAKQFARAKPEVVGEILETLVTMGRAHQKGPHFTR